MNLQAIYDGADGEVTKALYVRLVALGPIGEIGVNLFRASKCSARAKVYRDRHHKRDAYGRKNWSLEQLAAILDLHASTFGIVWGWGVDEHEAMHNQVLYVELCLHSVHFGQVSFHAGHRGTGPDFTGRWDGVLGASADRIVRWCQALLSETSLPPIAAAEPSTSADAPRWLWCKACCAFWSNRKVCPLHPSLRPDYKTPPAPLPEFRPGVRAEWDEAEG